MSLTFQVVDKVLKSYGLVSYAIKKGQFLEYKFEDRAMNTRRKKVGTLIKPLINGGVGGYLYIDHIKEYDNHPRKTKMGHIPIGNMTEEELIITIEKVIKDYR